MVDAPAINLGDSGTLRAAALWQYEGGKNTVSKAFRELPRTWTTGVGKVGGAPAIGGSELAAPVGNDMTAFGLYAQQIAAKKNQFGVNQPIDYLYEGANPGKNFCMNM